MSTDPYQQHQRLKPHRVGRDQANSDGKIYVCQCGQSDTLPLCDGSHNALNKKCGGDFGPTAYKFEDGQDEVWICGCRESTNWPQCNGTHNNLTPGDSISVTTVLLATTTVVFAGAAAFLFMKQKK